MRLFVIFAVNLLFCLSIQAEDYRPVTVKLSLGQEKYLYKSGEPILLSLTFVANASGYFLDTTITEPASPLDTPIVSPMTGVYAWLEDQARGHRYSPDGALVTWLVPGKPFTVTVPLNTLYRFDQRGHYSV